MNEECKGGSHPSSPREAYDIEALSNQLKFTCRIWGTRTRAIASGGCPQGGGGCEVKATKRTQLIAESFLLITLHLLLSLPLSLCYLKCHSFPLLVLLRWHFIHQLNKRTQCLIDRF